MLVCSLLSNLNVTVQVATKSQRHKGLWPGEIDISFTLISDI